MTYSEYKQLSSGLFFLVAIAANHGFAWQEHRRHPPSPHASECAVGVCQQDMQLLQKAISWQPLQPMAEVLPELMPLARSLTTENPEALAEYFVKYYGAQRVSTNMTMHMQTGCGVEFVGVQLSRQDGLYRSPQDKYTLYLVKDDRKWAGLMPRDTFSRLSDDAYDDMITSRKSKDHRPWVDFHDGIQDSWRWLEDPSKPNFNKKEGARSIKELVQDSVPVQNLGYKTMRSNIPNTSHFLEIDGVGRLDYFVDDGEESWWKSSQEADSGCRTVTNPDLVNGTSSAIDGKTLYHWESLWYKATHFIEESGLNAASEFAKNALGFVPISPGFPEPKQDGCIGAKWNARSTGDWFQLHFVSSSPPFPDMGASSYHDYQSSIRNLKSGCFDHYLYNSLILWSDSLDPFVRRLRQLDTPFLALKLQDQLFSLVFSFPNNAAIVIDIRSSELSEAEYEHFDPCMRTQCYD